MNLITKIKNFKNYVWHKIINFRHYTNNLNDNNKNLVLGRNIYSFDGKYKDFVKYHTLFHGFVKYTILVPAVYFIEFTIGRFLVNRVPNKPEFNQLYNFNKCFEQSLFIWCKHFLLRDKYKNGTLPSRTDINVLYNNNYSVRVLRTFKKLVITFCKNDSAYLEFINVLMLSITKHMNSKYHGVYHHLYYTNEGINDVFYFMIRDKFELINLQEMNDTNGTKTTKTKD